MTAPINEKPSAKTLLRKVIDAQPEDASYDEILRVPAFERMVERGGRRRIVQFDADRNGA